VAALEHGAVGVAPESWFEQKWPMSQLPPLQSRLSVHAAPPLLHTPRLNRISLPTTTRETFAANFSPALAMI
jgi:hypothetical protein